MSETLVEARAGVKRLMYSTGPYDMDAPNPPWAYPAGHWPAYTSDLPEGASAPRTRSPAQLANDARLRATGPARLAKANCQRDRINHGLPCMCGGH
jgi:hypothetical protein